jgi:hypothetical protein
MQYTYSLHNFNIYLSVAHHSMKRILWTNKQLFSGFPKYAV